MELGLDFEDTDLIEEKKTSDKKSGLKSYNAKVCGPLDLQPYILQIHCTFVQPKNEDKWTIDINLVDSLWFEHCEILDAETTANICKFRGDHKYYNKQYEEALLCYRQALESLPMTNRCMRHDLNESIARCYVALDKTAEALDLAQNLLNTSTNADQTTQACTLLQQIQHKQSDVQGEETTLKQLIMLHPFNAEFWVMLKRCFCQKFCLRELTKLEPQSIEYIKLLTCLVRARLLIRSVRTSVASFVKERHQGLIKEIEADIEKLNPSESCLACAKKHLGEDIFKLDNADDDKEREDLNLEFVNFEDRWFKWNQ